MKIGVLALQGAFIEHEKILRDLGVTPVEVRLPEHLADLDGLIIPGGESTTIGKLAVEFGLMEPLRRFAAERPTWGTCAGLIFLAKNIGIDRQPILGVMDITVNRNAFGRQVDSFATDLRIRMMGEVPFPAVFIRAPVITAVAPGVEVLAELPDGRIVAAQQGHLLATAFHPELTGDSRFHRYFVEMIKNEENLRTTG
ncbi:MAG: pyridoxal 5'-phosphate synthase glutaminase subunit PdxT [Anaerolineaceae bacterium]|nr:pyridoxal 5'-phosphate synthase glutaminase subunit PdxT [Anaerolineaceae bacterium]